jgi:hypothetical protein
MYVIPAGTKGPKEALFPRVLTIWLGLSASILLLKNFKRKEKDFSQRGFQWKEVFGTCSIIAFFLIYVSMIYFLGYITSSFAFLVGIMFFLGIRSWKVLILIPSGCLSLIYYLIVKLLSFQLPKGTLFNLF